MPSSRSELIRSIFRRTLDQVDVAAAVQRQLRLRGSALEIASETVSLADLNTILIVAVGKAAAPMCEGAVRALRDAPVALEAIVVAPQPPRDPIPALTFFPGAHPTPDADSCAAAQAVLHRLGIVDGRTLVLFLISGGASAMLEVSIDPEITIADTANFHRALVGSGLPIREMNVLRKHFSAVKGGRLAVAAANAAAQFTLVVSDVPEQALDVVSSGPTLADPSTLEEARNLFATLRSRTAVPESVIALFASAKLGETPKPDHPAFARTFAREILSSRDLGEFAIREAANAGFHVELDNTCDEWDYREAGVFLLDRVTRMAASHPRSCLISVGEISVPLTATHGTGGRNQQFALWCAVELARRGQRLQLLSAGSDGIDGNSPAAGAAADETTVARASAQGLSVDSALSGFDAFPLFQALGDAVLTGPTGNNLRDLRIFVTDPGASV